MVGEILKFELPEAGIWIPEINNQQSIQKSLQNEYIQDCLEEKKNLSTTQMEMQWFAKIWKWSKC